MTTKQRPVKAAWKNYLELTRLHKFPLGSILIFWPAAWGLTMAGKNVSQSPRTLVLEIIFFLLGSTLLHSAGCVVNDMCDRDIDARVERTKDHPLVVGTVSMFEATCLLVVLTVSNLALLTLSNRIALVFGVFGIIPFPAIYPLMKHWTWWPQVWLGLAVNWSLLIAWITVTGSIDTGSPAVLLVGSICWTIVYDTMYACQDRHDDRKIGVKSMAILFGSYVRPILAAFSAAFIVCLILAGYLNGQGIAYYTGSCGGAALHFLWQFWAWDPDVLAQAGERFRMNHELGLIIWAGMLLDYFLAHSR